MTLILTFCMMFGMKTKGLETQCLIRLAVAGFNLARTIIKASAMGLDTGQYDYYKGIEENGKMKNVTKNFR